MSNSNKSTGRLKTTRKSKTEKLVLWFQNVTKNDIPLVGGKNANLGEMIKAKLPIPPGFAVTAYAYKKFITEEKISTKIFKIIKETVTMNGFFIICKGSF